MWGFKCVPTRVTMLAIAGGAMYVVAFIVWV